MNANQLPFSDLLRTAFQRTRLLALSLMLISTYATAHEQVWRDSFTAGRQISMAKLNNGDFIVGGDIENTNDYDIVITRVTEDGTTVWQRIYNSLGNDSLTHLIADPVTGDTYVCGTRAQGVDWFIMKFKGSDGTNGWTNEHTYGYSGAAFADTARELSFVQDGSEVNIVAVGTVNAFGGRVVLLNAASGTMKWEHVSYLPPENPGYLTNVAFSHVATDVDGNIYVTGTFGASSDLTAALLKFNVSSNAQIWKQGYKPNVGGQNNWLNIAIEPVTKDVVVAGMLVSSAGNADMGIARYNPAGTRLWATQVDGGSIDRANALVVEGAAVYIGGIYRPGASANNSEWFVGSFSLATGEENWRHLDGGNAGSGDSLGNIQVSSSRVYAAGIISDTVTGSNVALLELNKSTGVVLERTVFTDQVDRLLAHGNQAMFVRSDGDLIVTTTADGTDIEIGRYTPDGGGEPPATAPTITTPTSASVAMNSATLGGNVAVDGGAAITERGVVYALTSTNSNPEIGGTSVTKVAAATPHGTGVFTVAVSSLVAKSGYTYKAYAQNSVGTVYTTASTFTTTGPTIAVTGNSTAITHGSTSTSTANHTEFVSVTVTGAASTSRTFTINNSGNANLTLATGSVTVTGTDFTVSTPPATSVAGAGFTTFTVAFNPSTTGVKTATVSIASNDPATSTYTFAIQGKATDKPSVTSLNVTAIKGYSATLNASVTPNGLTTTYTFEYSTESNVPAGSLNTSSASLGVSAFAAGAASAGIAELQPETTYYYRLVASNADGTTTSGISNFTTGFPLTTNEPLTAANGMPEGGLIYRPIPGVINNAGHILFQSVGLVGSGTPTITGANDELLMNDVTGIPRVILREGTQLGSESGETASALFNHLLLGESGQSFTSEKITGATSDKDYAYLVIPETNDSVDLVSREGDEAPDGGVFVNSVGKPALDSEERLYFQGSLSGIATTLATGVWYDNGEGLSTLVQAGQDITEITGDEAWLGKISNILAAGGNGASFVAALQANPADTKKKTDTLRNQAIISANVSGVGTELSIIARKGELISGGSSVNTITAVSRSVNEDHAYLALMKTGIAGVTTTTDEVLVAIIEGEPTVVVREGTTILDGGLTPKSFGDFYVTAAGDVVFQAVLNGAPATSDGILCIWDSETDTLVKLAREGDLAPQTGGLNYGTLHTLGVSDNGNIVLQTILSDGKHALHRNVGAGFELVVKAGPTNTVDFGGTPRAILSIGLYNKTTGTGGGGGGMGSAINDSGDIFAVLSIGTGDYVARVYRGQPLPEPN